MEESSVEQQEHCSMTYFFLLFSACSDQKPAKTEVVEPAQTVKFEKFDINATCVKNTDAFQKMFSQYQNQIQTCFANTSEKTLDITVNVKNGSVNSGFACRYAPRLGRSSAASVSIEPGSAMDSPVNMSLRAGPER